MARQAIRLTDGTRKRTLAKRQTFTIKALEGIKPPAAGRVWVYDTRVPGLGVMVTANNARAFYSYRKVNGRPQRVRLGSVDELSIEQARDLAADVTLKVRTGVDPMREKRAAGEGLTLADAWDHWLNRHAKVHLKDISNCEARYRLYLKPWASRLLADIDRQAVVTLHNRIGAMSEQVVVEVDGKHYKTRRGGKGTANRTMALLSSIINTARSGLAYAGANPVAGAKRFHETSRTRFLQPDEIPRFNAALAAEPNQTAADYFRVALLTGGRTGNVKAMRWTDVNLDAGEWRIPGQQFKNGQEQRVVLPGPAVTILKTRRGTSPAPASPWVFAAATSASGHIETPVKSWKRICKAAGLEGLNPHDLRRSAAVYALASGASPATIAAALGHKSTAATAIYARLNLQPVQQAMNAAATMMAAAGQPAKDETPARNVRTRKAATAAGR